MKMHGLPVVADAFEDERHAAGSRVGLAVEGLRLRPEARYYGAVASQHGDVPIANIEFHIFALRERTLAIPFQLIPSSGNGTVVVEQHQRR